MAGPLLVMAYVTRQDRNDLLVCTSSDGVNWSPNKPTRHFSKMTPVLATSSPRSG